MAAATIHLQIACLRKLNKLQESLLGEESLEEKLKKVTEGVVKIFHADFCRIWIAMPGDLCNFGCNHANPMEKKNSCRIRKSCLHLKASSGRYTHIDGPHKRMPFGLYKLGRIATGKVNKFLTNEVVNDPHIMDHEWAKKFDLVSFAGYKLQNTSGKPIGVLALFSKQPITTEESTLLEGLAGTTSQVVQSSEAEEALKVEHNKLHSILNSMGNGVYIVNQACEIEYTNPVIEKEFGPINGRKCFEYFHNRTNICPWCKNKVVFGGKTVQWEWFSKKTNKTYDLSDTPLLNLDGSISKLGIIHDITDRKQAEKELAFLNNELKDKNKELEQVINITSHDLRSPLLNISGSTKELEKKLMEITPIINDRAISPSVKMKRTALLEEDIAEECDFIRACSSKMDNLISGLVQVSRLGRIGLNITPLNMNKLVASIAKSFDYIIKRSGTKLEIYELPPCRGDAVRIDQVFSNLLDNALKYLNQKRPGIIKISGQAKTGQVTYCVEDNGIGIQAKHQEKVFEIFCRLDPKTGTGEGLGLSIINKILTRHGGKVWVESEPDKGSKFFVSLKI